VSLPGRTPLIQVAKEIKMYDKFTKIKTNFMKKELLLAFGLLTLTSVLQAQDKGCIGKWKLYPKPQDGLISYLTVSEKSNEYTLVRTKDPKQKWKMTWNEKTKAFDVNLDGKKGTINLDNTTKHLVFKSVDGGKFEMEPDK
jgi:hypothetical protein